jgi:hypothetical protein
MPTFSDAQAVALCDSLGIEATDSNIGLIVSTVNEIDPFGESDARNLCYALRIDDGDPDISIILEAVNGPTVSGSAVATSADPAAEASRSGVDPSSDSSAPAASSPSV